MHIPFVDLRGQYAGIRDEVLSAISGVLDDMELNPGRNVEALEREFAAYCGASRGVGVGSGTDALHLILRGYGIGAGDEVITVAHTFAATAESILMTGATPVFVDVDPVTMTMDPVCAEAAVTGRTKALMPVHLYGQTADMDNLVRLAHARGLRVIEDACQAHGASYGERRAGTLGDAAAFSFYCGKNLGAYGEAGMVVTDDERLAAVLRTMRDHGSESKYRHSMLGVNARMDEIQAAVLRVKLRYLEDWNRLRREHAEAYGRLLEGLRGAALPVERTGSDHVYHLYVIEVDDRDAVRRELGLAGVSTGIHYPVPVHLHPPYRAYGGGEGSLPVTEAKASRILSLPMFPELSASQIMYAATALHEVLAKEAHAA
ncbi:MAG: DegT/DnrJ/EryC1/StrS family aminotransferase [Dehalococcoidia bacterium]